MPPADVQQAVARVRAAAERCAQPQPATAAAAAAATEGGAAAGAEEGGGRKSLPQEVGAEIRKLAPLWNRWGGRAGEGAPAAAAVAVGAPQRESTHRQGCRSAAL